MYINNKGLKFKFLSLILFISSQCLFFTYCPSGRLREKHDLTDFRTGRLSIMEGMPHGCAKHQKTLKYHNNIGKRPFHTEIVIILQYLQNIGSRCDIAIDLIHVVHLGI